MSFLVSGRGHALLLENFPSAGDKPVVTVEAYTKWYGLYVVTPSALAEYRGRSVSGIVGHLPVGARPRAESASRLAVVRDEGVRARRDGARDDARALGARRL